MEYFNLMKNEKIAQLLNLMHYRNVDLLVFLYKYAVRVSYCNENLQEEKNSYLAEGVRW